MNVRQIKHQLKLLSAFAGNAVIIISQHRCALVWRFLSGQIYDPFFFLSSARSQHGNQSALLHLKEVNTSNGWPGYFSGDTERVCNLFTLIFPSNPTYYPLKGGSGWPAETRGEKKKRRVGKGLNRGKKKQAHVRGCTQKHARDEVY